VIGSYFCLAEMGFYGVSTDFTRQHNIISFILTL
jgi:hypothetical protein